MIIHFYILALIGLFTILFLSTGSQNKKLPAISKHWTFSLLIYAILIIAFSPTDLWSDKYAYLRQFNSITYSDLLDFKDIGWGYYNYLVKIITGSSVAFFLITAIVYLLGYYIFAKKFISAQYHFIFLYACIISMSFFAYGINTIRAGFALSLFLIGITKHKNKLVFLLWGLAAVSMHKSIILPFLAFILTGFYDKPIVFFRFWCIALILSFINVSFIYEFFQSNLGSFDERSSYLDINAETHYKTGFRVDFILYSFVPILFGLYYILKLKIRDIIYSRLFSSYLIVNAIWLLVIRMNFTDRFAYLSWFLIPFIILYPLITYRLALNQRKLVGIVLLGMISFTLLMNFI